MKIRNFLGFSLRKRKKSHTCEEGGAHFRIFSWHLLMNFKKPEKSEFWKNEKKFTHVYQKPQWCTVPEIQSQNEFFLSFWAIFCPFTPNLPRPPSPPSHNYPENQNLEKMKKASGDVIILNLSNNKQNHMMYAYSDMECNRQFFVILGHLLLFYPNTEPEN